MKRATPTLRLPDFIIIGAMKSGTTSLFQWLADQPELSVPTLKEPNFFSDDPQWRKGLKWYGGLFASAHADRLVGEASIRYTALSCCDVAARRMAATVPDARLIYMMRHPLDRIRSHYRHWVSYMGKSESLAAALAMPENEFVGRSLYFRCMTPYIEAFPREQLCIIRFEDLLSEPRPAWSAVLAHLGLPDRPAPGMPYNVSARLPHYPAWMGRLWLNGFLRPLKYFPRSVRQYGKRLLGPASEDHAELLERSRAPIPDVVSDLVWQDVARLEKWLGMKTQLWVR